MTDVAIRCEGLGKRYRTGQLQPLGTLKQAATDAIYGAFRRLRPGRGRDASRSDGPDRFIWALRDASFEVKHGEVLGLIGPNGAGKTTLLKVLSRITNPTEGHAEVSGRVGSLLEVGTGFHGELTGRENVYLNGAILGMKKAEITRKFDEIVGFAGDEVARLIDTPLKRYSTGMGTRLAFAVAAHLEPEVMLVDEVLAVGDYEFQKKCIGKMRDVGESGRTVVLVSHNLASILNLCPRAILLEHGRITIDGPTKDVVSKYIEGTRERSGEVVWTDPTTAPGTDRVRLRAVRILTEDGTPTADVDIAKAIVVQIEYWNLDDGAKLSTGIHLKDRFGGYVLASMNMPSASVTPDCWWDRPRPAALFRSECRLPGEFLNEGTYSITAVIGSSIKKDEVRAEDIVSFGVFDTGAMRKEYYRGWFGVVRPRLAWQTEKIDSATTAT